MLVKLCINENHNMRRLIILFFTFSLALTAQENNTIEIDSKILSETRTLNIHIPESYCTSEKSYPVIYSLDGEYTNLALSGVLDYYSYWDKTPECIVVSIEQNYLDTLENMFKRWIDCSYSWKTGLPINKGIDFKKFISQELIPFIDSSYRTTNFRTFIGHSLTANYINYFLLDKEPLFTGYVAISPYYASNHLDSLETIIKNLNKPIFYYVASGENDLSGHIKSVKKFDKRFTKIDNENFVYQIFDVKNNRATHSTIFPKAIPSAIEHLFSMYKSMSKDEFKKALKEDDKVKYLLERYATIEDIYGVKVPIREMDLNHVGSAISKKKQWNQLKQIAELSIKIYPESFLGYYQMGEYFEEVNNFTAALEQYEIGFSKLGDDILNIEVFRKDIDRVKKKIK